MEDAQQGTQLKGDCLPEMGEDAMTSVGPSSASIPMLTDEEQEELRRELAKVEDEIQTLSQVLAAKEKQVVDIKKKLGITPLTEFKENITKGWQEVTTSTTYKKTSETFSQAGLKAAEAFTNMGTAITRKFEDVRNTPSFKSLEEKMENLKTKMNAAGLHNHPIGIPGEPMIGQDEATPNQEPPTH